MFTIRKLQNSLTDAYFYLEILKSSTVTEEEAGSFIRTFSEVNSLTCEDILKDNMLEGAFGVFYMENNSEKIIGLGIIRQTWKTFSRGNHDFHIGPVYILPEFRGKGLGRKIMQTLENEALSLTTSKIIKFDLGVTLGLDIAMKLYLSLGYTIVGTDPKYLQLNDGIYLDRVLMIKLIYR